MGSEHKWRFLIEGLECHTEEVSRVQQLLFAQQADICIEDPRQVFRRAASRRTLPHLGCNQSGSAETLDRVVYRRPDARPARKPGQPAPQLATPQRRLKRRLGYRGYREVTSGSLLPLGDGGEGKLAGHLLGSHGLPADPSTRLPRQRAKQLPAPAEVRADEHLPGLGPGGIQLLQMLEEARHVCPTYNSLEEVEDGEEVEEVERPQKQKR